MLMDALLGEGVPEDDIQMSPSEAEAVNAALRMGQSDDLILMFGDALTRTWNQITQFRPDSGTPDTDAPLDEVVAIELPDLPSEEMELSAKIMRDERGVFLAPELDD